MRRVAEGIPWGAVHNAEGPHRVRPHYPAPLPSPSCHQHQLFNVDTVDVVLRLRRAAWPFFSQSFFETIGDNPDLYGPVWICTTLVFVIGVASNLSSWVALPTGKVGPPQLRVCVFSELPLAAVHPSVCEQHTSSGGGWVWGCNDSEVQGVGYHQLLP